MNFPEEKSKVFVHGTSMLPLMRSGDVPQMTPVAREAISPGDVIVFRDHSKKFIIHRAMRLEPQLVTRGDNCDHDDPPVPENSPLWKVAGFFRDQKMHRVSGGKAGMRQFRRHQFRQRCLLRLRRIGGAVLNLNPIRYPFSKLKKVQFQKRCVYYFGQRPVGYFKNGRWHWLMRFARFWIGKPPTEP